VIRLRPSEPGFEEDLSTFLCRHECQAEVVKDRTVVVEPPHALHEEQALRELGLYVRLWQALRGITVCLEHGTTDEIRSKR
jgi:hypothetical protein